MDDEYSSAKGRQGAEDTSGYTLADTDPQEEGPPPTAAIYQQPAAAHRPITPAPRVTMAQAAPAAPLDPGYPAHAPPPPGRARAGKEFDTVSLNSLGQMPEESRPDYILVYKSQDSTEKMSEKKRKVFMFHERNRARFKEVMLRDGLHVYEELSRDETKVYVKVRAPFRRLCIEAERNKLDLPLKGCEIYDDDAGCCSGVEKKFVTDADDIDYVSAPFELDKIALFEGYDNQETFFRPSLRSLLVNNILKNLDIQDKTLQASEEAKRMQAKSKEEEVRTGCCGSKVLSNEYISFKDDTEMQRRKAAADEDDSSDLISKKGLRYMLMKKSYEGEFIPHEESNVDPVYKGRRIPWHEEKLKQGEKSAADYEHVPNGTVLDARRDLQNSWTKFFKFQPLWKVRNYYGERIAFYFAWSGTLISSLWVPTLIGLGIFIYGLYLSILRTYYEDKPTVVANNTIDALKAQLDDLLSSIKEAFDNGVTPVFGLLICIWGTIFLEMWKRKNATLAYHWDVNNFEDAEPDRPQFVGTHTMPDPVTKATVWHYPLMNRVIKYSCSVVVLVFMILVVCASVTSVVAFRVILEVDYCNTGKFSTIQCFVIVTVCSSLLNAVSILILGKLYDKIAYVLTDWENHRTQTAYDDALVIKLFAFQFVNSYSSLYYIAFFRQTDKIFRGGVFGRGTEYADYCTDRNCMSHLSFLVLVLMIAKPFPKFLKDIILPWLRKVWHRRARWFCRCSSCCRPNAVDEAAKGDVTMAEYLENEYKKPELGDFTLGEYNEKVIQYGYLMLFAVAFPLAPLIALITNFIDIRVDARRLLWFNRRPVALIAQDIGMWYQILQVVNVLGVISNAFVVAYTSSYGATLSTSGKLWFILAFEHGVFFFKYILEVFIPDEPASVRLAKRREKFQVSRILQGDLDLKRGETVTNPDVPRSSVPLPTPPATYHGSAPPPARLHPIDADMEMSEVRRRKKKRKHRKNKYGQDDGVTEGAAADGSPGRRPPEPTTRYRVHEERIILGSINQ